MRKFCCRVEEVNAIWTISVIDKTWEIRVVAVEQKGDNLE